MTSQKTILIVEDSADIRTLLVRVLKKRQYVTLEASNGEEALDVLRSGEARPDLILLDLMMPVKDGFGFRHEQLQMPQAAEIPVVVMSASTQAESKKQDLKVDIFLQKPVDLEDVIAAIERYF